MVERPGPGVDVEGRAVVDPTENVLQLVEAANRRQDDLRRMESSHVREILGLRAHYMEKLSAAEAKRIDAIRAVDVAAVQRAAEVAGTLAQTLATQVTTTADAMRVSQAAAIAPLTTAIEDLRRSQYEAQGQKTQVVETQAGGRNVALWVGLGISAVALLISFVVAVVAVLVATGTV
jgi:hypothetical protein